MNYKLTESTSKVAASKGKYVGRVCHYNTLNGDAIAQEIEHNCSLTRGDALAAVVEIGKLLNSHLKAGDVVKLPYIGTFKLEMETIPVDDPKDFRIQKHLRRFQLHVLPEKRNGKKELYNDIELTKID